MRRALADVGKKSETLSQERLDCLRGWSQGTVTLLTPPSCPEMFGQLQNGAFVSRSLRLLPGGLCSY